MRRFFLMCATLLASGVMAFAYTNELEKSTNITITTGWDALGDMTVGGTTSSNTLIIASGGSLTNVNAFVGASTNALNNTATISGAGAEWINSGTLQVGVVGNSNNTVSVSGGGTVSASNLVVAAGNDFNLNNSGTLALESGFDISTDGFNWAAGGTLSVGGALTGLATTNEGAILSGGKNLILNGGSLTTTTNLIVGYESSNNTLAITNGATASNADGYIGWGTNSANNSVLVSDSGSAWTNSGNLYVGVYGDSTNLMTAGAGNSLTVTNDALVFVGGIDTNLPSTGGIAVGDGAEMVVGDSASILTDGLYINTNGTFELNGTLEVNHSFDADQVGFNWEDGATLVVHSNLTLTADLVGINQTLSVDGGSWDRSGSDLKIAGAGNTLSITNGGGVINDAGYVIGSSNTVLVSGTGSTWLNNGSLNITNVGNRVTVDDGGRVTADSLNVTDGNQFNLNSGGTLAMTTDFDVSGQSNLNWNSGGNLSVGGEFSGLTNLTGGRVLTLDGSAARWDLSNTNMTVGGNATLIATDGAMVKAANFYVEGANNSVNIETGSWLLVGDAATTNTLADGGALVASTNGALLSVDNYSSLSIAETLQVGLSNTETGMVSVANNSTITAGGLEIYDANSAFNLENSGTLAITGGFNAEQAGFNWEAGGTLSVGGALTLDAFGGTNRTLEIAEDGSWTTATNLITGTGNTLLITDGGQVTNQTAFIGVSSNDWGNTVLVSGTGSVWTLTEDLWVNSSNTLELASTGLVSIDGNMTVSNATVAGSGTVALTGGTSSLSIYGTQSQSYSNVLFTGNGGDVAFTDSELIVDGSLSNRFVGFEDLNMTNSLLAGTGSVDGFTKVDMTGGWINPAGELTIDGTFVANGTVLQVDVGTGSNLLHLTSGFDLSTMGAEVVVQDGLDPKNLSQTILVSDVGLTNAFDTSISDITEHYLLYDFNFDSSSGTNVSVVSEVAQDGTISASLAYGGVQGVRAGFNGMQNALFVRTKQLRRNTVATDHAISNEAYLMSSTNAPSGPQGPGDRNTIFGMHFWAEQFSGQGDYDAQGVSEGFSLNNNGTTFGFDRLFGDSLVAGINYTYARSAALESGGDRVDTETYWLGLYGEWSGKNDYYLEGLIGLGWTDYETTRIDGGYAGEGKFEGSDFGGHLEAGKYFHRNNWAMAPYAGLQYLSIKSDAYTEKSVNPIEVDGQNIASLESALGVKLRNRFDTQAGRFQTVGYAEWAYDFINDDIGSTLSDGTISVATARVAPGASLFNGGIGLSWICTDYLEVGVGYDGRFNENYEEHMGSIMLDVRF